MLSEKLSEIESSLSGQIEKFHVVAMSTVIYYVHCATTKTTGSAKIAKLLIFMLLKLSMINWSSANIHI